MPAHQKVLRRLEFALPLVFIYILLGTMMHAQTSIDDVHVMPRQTREEDVSSQLTLEPALPLIRTDARLVLVPVSVTDPNQRFVTGLHRDNFEVYEGKTPQTIQHFSNEDMPVSIGIILDVSGSMSDKFDRVRDAVSQFCDAANSQDEFFMVAFNDQPRLANDFTTNPDDIRKELVFTIPKGRTSLLDGIHMGLQKMKRARYGKKALLIISDGGDNHSRYGEKAVKATARESDVMIYSIGIFDRYVPTPEELRGPELLSELAEPTGGRAFTIDNPKAMASVARRIGEELRTQYVLAYRPQEVPHDGKWRKIRVKLKLPNHLPFLQAHAKTGYYAAAEPGFPVALAPVQDRRR